MAQNQPYSFANLFKPLVDPFAKLGKGPATPVAPSLFSAPANPINFSRFAPKNPVSPFNIGRTTPNASVMPPNASTPTGPAYFPPPASFATQPAPKVTAPVAPTPAKPAIPVVPTATPAAATATAPTAPPQAPQNAPETPQTPTVPQISPEVQNAVNLAEKAYQQSLAISPDELSTQEDIDKLIESTQKAYQNTQDQAIPLEFITGQLSSIERRATNLAEPLERKMARLQAARQSSIEGSKFALERSDKALESERTKVRQSITDAESLRRFDVEQAGSAETRKLQRDEFALTQKKFDEDKRQFGLNYALAAQKTAQEATAKAADKTNASNEALGGYSLVNELLSNSGLNAITGVPGVSAFFPGTNAQLAKNQYNQVKAILSLENRQKLKGSGAISDFEAKSLADASSALGTNLSNEAFKKQLRKVRGAFATSAGLSAPVKVTDPKTGKVDDGSLSRDQINSAITQGFTVEYQ